ncbi:M16 family metallopeptidase [Candidatus Deianiraea vastatrix]|nr:pitrilysin family protein [Candidatus Deianiraea vastatrix]
MFFINNYNKVKKTILKNGITVITENNNSKLAGIVIGIRGGSIYEDAENYGYAHILEHLLFKGTKTRNADEISFKLSRGGYQNAETSYLNVLYYSQQMNEDLNETIKIYFDMLQNFYIKDEDFDKEIKVILEEYRRWENSHYSRFAQFANEALFNPESGFSHVPIGIEDVIKNATLEKLQNFMKQKYTGSNIVVSVSAGNIKHKDIVKLVEENSQNIDKGKINNTKEEPVFNYQKLPYAFKKDLKYNGIIIAICFNANNFSKELQNKKTKLYHVSSIFSNIVCQGGSRSIFFKKMREENGLIYGSYCDPTFYPNNLGFYCVNVNTSAESAEKVYKIMVDEFIDSINNIPQDLFNEHYNSAKPSYIIDAEKQNNYTTSMRKAFRNQEKTMHNIHYFTKKEDFAIFENISLDDVNEFSKQLINDDTRPIILVFSNSEININPDYLKEKIANKKNEIYGKAQ